MYEAVIYPHVELIEVRFPGTVRVNTVRPAYIGVVSSDTLPVIDKICRITGIVDYTVIFAEHKDSGQCEAFFAGFIFSRVGSDLLQKIHIADTRPRVSGLQAGEGLTVLVQCLNINIPLKIKSGKNTAVL